MDELLVPKGNIYDLQELVKKLENKYSSKHTFVLSQSFFPLFRQRKNLK